MKSFKDICKKESLFDYLNEIKNKTLVIYSPTSSQKTDLFKKIDNNNLIFLNANETDIDVNKINKYLKKCEQFETVVGFGGGTANDIAKYIGNKEDKYTVSIPSMLSTNVYSTNKVLMNEDGEVKTLDSKLPDLIIYDENVLKLSEVENMFGFADVLTIYTASKDWMISYQNQNDDMNENIYKMDIDLVNNTKNYILQHSYDEIKDNLFEIFNFIGMVGHITNLYGSGRPVSGSEHIFAKSLEQKILVPHGISVGIGILIMSLFQNNYSKEIETCFKKIKIFDYANKYKITQKLIMNNLMELKPREGRYTIVNTLNRYDEEVIIKIKEILDKFNIPKE